MQPRLFGYSSYFLLWSLAAIACFSLGLYLARRDGGDVRRRLLVGALLFALILVGSKALYGAEAIFFPGEDYVPAQFHGLAHGFRIPGGIALVGVVAPFVVRLAGLPWPRFGDRFVVVVAVMTVFIRIGCLMNGCCFGRVSSLPWTVTFPRESWAFYYQVTRGQIAPSAEAPLPVHPLQIYFIIAALITLGVIVWQLNRVEEAGLPYLTFFAMFFASTLILEPLRANHLTLNNWLVLAGTVT
ncbi:MAG: prolipoprotein diacylglyceryl transferase family protein, partial [Armatimonadota bacterium]